MLKEPVVLKAKNSFSSTAGQSANQSGFLPSKTSQRNVWCGDGFFRTTEPTRQELLEKRGSELTPSDLHNTTKSSIHSIMKKKSPCGRRSEIEESDRMNQENSSMRGSAKEVTALQEKVQALQAKLAEAVGARTAADQEKKQLSDTCKNLSKAFEHARLGNEMLTRQLNAHRVEGQMLKSRLADRTSKLEQCLQILKTKYNHFQRTAQKTEACQSQTLREKTLEMEMVRLKQELIDVYQQNHELKTSLQQLEEKNKSAVQDASGAFDEQRRLLIQWKANLEQHYKVKEGVNQNELTRQQLKLKHQRESPCFKCNELCRIVIALNDELNEYRRQDSMEVALVATDAYGRTAEGIADRLCLEPSSSSIR